MDSLLSMSVCFGNFCQSSSVTKGMMGCSSLHVAQIFLHQSVVHMGQIDSQVGCRVAVDHIGLSALEVSQLLPDLLGHEGHVRVKETAGCRISDNT